MKGRKHYLIDLYDTRSKIALFAGVLVLGCTICSITYELQHLENWKEYIFHFFTILSNMFSSVGAVFMVPYAVEGIRRKRFILPKWIVILQYSGATCVAITMVTTLLILLPAQGLIAISGTNLFLHIVSPVLTIALFQCVETGVILNRKHVVMALAPYWIYMCIYYYNVVILGKSHGGWSDFYMVASLWPAWISVILMFILGIIIASVLMRLHNFLCRKGLAQLTGMWRDDMEDAELLIEAFGLGRYMGSHCDESDLVAPIDIFRIMHERYGVSVEALSRAFIKGALDSIDGRGKA